MKRRAPRGFTIVEVILFLAISTTLLIVSIRFLSGSEASKRFSQSMRDINSKMQDWFNDVPTGFAGAISGTGASDFRCQVPGGLSSPQIFKSGVGPDNPDCIFLGKAVQIREDDTQIYTYSVFGRRATGNDVDSPLVSGLADARPVAATGQAAAGNADLTETYTLKGGAKAKSVLTPNSYLAGFYLSFNPTSVKTNGSADLLAYQYGFTDSSATPGNQSGGSAITDCISNCSPAALTDWQICFESSDEVQTAVLSVKATNGTGVTTNLEFKEC